MKNWEALKALNEGKAVRHSSWPPGERCLSIMNLDSEELCLVDGWAVFEDPRPWSWACEQLLAGRSVRRSSWNEGVSFRFNSGKLLSCSAQTLGCEPVYLCRDDFEATDWVIA